MKRWLLMWVALSSLLLSGCASVIRTDVIAFHDWPADLQNKTYVFDHKVDQNNLEEKSYENLVRTELTRLGFVEAAAPNAPNLKVALKYKVDTRDVRTVQPYVVDPYWYGPYYGPGWRYGPYYDPFWYPGPITQYRDVQYQVFDRQLNILITRFKDGKKLYDVTVHSSGGNGSLAFVMPYLVRAAFTDFPGKNGVPRRIDLEIKE